MILKTTRYSGLGDYARLSLCGIARGASDTVPGVSCGTMTLILGIYEELINSIRTMGRPALWQAAVRFQIKEIFQIVNWQYFARFFYHRCAIIEAGLALRLAIFGTGIVFFANKKDSVQAA